MNNVWAADDYLNDRNCDPIRTDRYLYATREEAEAKAKSLPISNEVYNEGSIFTGELTDDEILELSGYETIDEFNDALAEPYSTDANVKNLGEFEKADVAAAIVDDHTDEETVECANYNFDKSLEGAVLVFWSWEKYIGYARKCIEVRYATADDKEELLTKQDKVYATQCDVLLTADEVAAADNIQEAVSKSLSLDYWKWNNPSFVNTIASEF